MKPIFITRKKTKFNHNASNVIEALNLNETLINKAEDSILSKIQKLKDVDYNPSISELVEIVLDEGLTIEEIAFLSFTLGRSFESAASRYKSPLKELMEGLNPKD